jgi:ABC-type nitrate/sulfonate/bicarbonate transport system substrate-binding protein
MSRSRVVFFLIIGVAILVVIGAGLFQSLQRDQQAAGATSVAQATLTAVGLPGNTGANIVPIFAGGQPPTDPLPKYVCAADAFGSYYALQQMQVAGHDVKYGFHLGIVPIALDDNYNLTEEARTSLLESGEIDCLFTTLDSAALTGAGIITAIIDESAGADQLWARPTIKTLNDLRGKKIIFPSGSVSEFFALYSLAVAGLNKSTVTLIPADSIEETVKRFNQGQADAASGWRPDIEQAGQGGAVKLIGSDKLRVIIDVIMTSRQAIKERPQVVQAFHNAWFRTLKDQFENFPAAAKQIADWGNSDWTGINPATAEVDFGKLLEDLAQAGLTQNSAAMNDTSAIIERLDMAKYIWEQAGEPAYKGQSAELVNPDFVKQAASRPDLATTGTPRNTTFLLTSRPNLKAISPDEGETLAVLPCRKFDFLPNSTQLTSESRKTLDTCVIPILHSSTGVYLKIVGSAAWLPGDDEKINREVAIGRAQSVAKYLESKGIDPQRFSLDVRVPPEERRGITDGLEQAKDRYVEMTLITVGR